MPLQRGLFMSLTIRNDMLYSAMVDGTTPNLIAFVRMRSIPLSTDNNANNAQYLATVRHLGGTDAQLQAAWDAHAPGQTPLRVDVDPDDDSGSSTAGSGRVDVFRTLYGRRLVAPARSLHNNLVYELLRRGTTSPPLWTGLFALYGLPLVHLSDALEAQTAVYAKQALALAASNMDRDLSFLFAEVVQTAAAPPLPDVYLEVPRAPLDILASLAFDGRLASLPLALPGYADHGRHGMRRWSSVPAVRDAVLACTRQWGTLVDPVHALDALEELGRTAVVLACGTHKPGDVAFDFYLCFLVTLVCSLRTVLVGWHHDRAVQAHAADMVRCLWALFVLVYILQLRPAMDVALLGGSVSGELGHFHDFHADPALALPKHQDPFYLRTLRSMAVLAACERDRGWQILIGNAASKFRHGWQRWLGFQPDEGASMNVRI